MNPRGRQGSPEGHGARPLTRREVLKRGGAGALAGAALIYSFDKLPLGARASGRLGAARRGELADMFAPFRVDVPRLPVLDPVDTSGGVDRYAITMRAGTAEILHGADPTPIWGYDARFPGPTIRARQGRPVEITQTNELPEEMTVHLHGGFQEEESDGPLHQYHIPPNEQRTYHYPNDAPQATLWYHDHVHGLSGPHLNAGLTAFYVIGSDLDDELELPQGEYDVPLMIQDRSFKDDSSFHYVRALLPGFHGDTILVNGAIAPRMRVHRRLYRLRFLNASNARTYRLVLGNGRAMHQIATDGGLADRPHARSELRLAAAERVEVLIDFSQFRPGAQLTLHNAGGGPSTTDVMRFDVVAGGGAEEFRIPSSLREPESIPAPQQTREITLELTADPEPVWTIDGKPFANDRVDYDPVLGTTEDWRLVNNSDHPHPMHVHGAHFRVLEVNGAEPHPADRGWKDTVDVPAAAAGEPGTALIRPYFEAFAGRFVLHCHTAEHSDNSMMAIVEYQEP